MEMALYEPTVGYYASGEAGIGRMGDFFTNVSVGEVFGHILAGQYEEMWRALGSPDEFHIVEQGAHDGRLAADILGALPAPFLQAVRYMIIEPSGALQSRQKETLGEWSKKTSWVSSVETLPDFQGVHFSNELVDALPFHLLRSTGSDWQELFVTLQEGSFAFEAATPSPCLVESLGTLPIRAEGTLAELRPAASAWLRSVSTRLQAGYILIIDYGYPRDQLYLPHRTRGTFSCYRDHRRDDDPLNDPGEKDITSHIDFTQLAETALATGLSIEGYTDQHHFIVGAGERLLRSLEGRLPDPAARKTLRGIQTLMHPESMGTQFRYLALSKNLPSPSPLSGFRHARPAHAELLAKPAPLV